MSARFYDDGLLPDHERNASEVSRLTHRIADLEMLVRKLVRDVSDLKGRTPV